MFGLWWQKLVLLLTKQESRHFHDLTLRPKATDFCHAGRAINIKFLSAHAPHLFSLSLSVRGVVAFYLSEERGSVGLPYLLFLIFKFWSYSSEVLQFNVHE